MLLGSDAGLEVSLTRVVGIVAISPLALPRRHLAYPGIYGLPPPAKWQKPGRPLDGSLAGPVQVGQKGGILLRDVIKKICIWV